MENASKALMMAATVLLGIFLLTAMIYLFRAGGKVSKAYDDKQINQQLEAHNGQFEYYDTPYNTITDVVSLANLVYSTNEECEYSEGYAVQLDIDIEGTIFTIPSEYKNANATKIEEKKYLTQRNLILKGNDVVDIYTLLNTSLNEIDNTIDKISKWNPPDDAPNKSLEVLDNETLTQTRLDENNKRVYKYIFVCESGDNFKYYDETGRVKYIKLKLYTNHDYEP